MRLLSRRAGPALVNSILDRCNRRKTGRFYHRSNISAGRLATGLHAVPQHGGFEETEADTAELHAAFTQLKTRLCLWPVVVSASNERSVNAIPRRFYVYRCTAHAADLRRSLTENNVQRSRHVA